jgi:hypothetical protein
LEVAVYLSRCHGGLGGRCDRRLDRSKIAVFGL